MSRLARQGFCICSAPMRAEVSRASKPVAEARCLLAELFGTFALTFVGAGAIVIQELSAGELHYVDRSDETGIRVRERRDGRGKGEGEKRKKEGKGEGERRGEGRWARRPG